MKKLFRSMFLVVILALLVAPVATVSAQDCPTGYTADDCKLLAAAEANLASLKDFAMDYTVNLKVTGAPDGDVLMDVKGTGGMDLSKLAMGAADPEAVKNLVMQMTADAMMKASGQDQAGTMEIRIVDGVIYIKMSQMGDTWFKVGLDEAMAAGGMGSLGDPTQLAGMAGDPMVAGLMEAFGQIPGFLTYAASDGPTVDGVPTRALSVSVSVEALVKGLTSDSFRPQLMGLLGGLGMGEIDEASLQQLTAMVSMFEPVLKSTKIELVQYIGTTDSTNHGIDLKFAINVDQMTGSMLGLPNALAVDFTFTVRLSKVNAGFAVEVPADAQELPMGQ